MTPATPGWVVLDTRDGQIGLVIGWLCDPEIGDFRPVVVLGKSNVAVAIERTPEIELAYAPGRWPKN